MSSSDVNYNTLCVIFRRCLPERGFTEMQLTGASYLNQYSTLRVVNGLRRNL